MQCRFFSTTAFIHYHTIFFWEKRGSLTFALRAPTAITFTILLHSLATFFTLRTRIQGLYTEYPSYWAKPFQKMVAGSLFPLLRMSINIGIHREASRKFHPYFLQEPVTNQKMATHNFVFLFLVGIGRGEGVILPLSTDPMLDTEDGYLSWKKRGHTALYLCL